MLMHSDNIPLSRIFKNYFEVKSKAQQLNMPRFYCDYCDVYLTHDSFSGRKQHMIGRKHQDNVRQYYMQFLKPGVLNNTDNILVPGMGSVPVGITYNNKYPQVKLTPKKPTL